MEDTLGAIILHIATSIRTSLNPCFNGRYSRRLKCAWANIKLKAGLNPCFNGRYSRSNHLIVYNYGKEVLILVLMEDTLGDIFTEWDSIKGES